MVLSNRQTIARKQSTDGLPQLTEKGLVNTEENQRRTLYYRDTLRYRETLGSQGHTTRYNECGDSLGRNSKDPSKCKVTPAAAIAQEDPFFDKVTVAGKKIKYNQYGKDDAAFTRVHFKRTRRPASCASKTHPASTIDAVVASTTITSTAERSRLP